MFNIIQSKHTAEVLISEDLASQVAILHQQCPSNTEWSGLLVYEILKGGIDDLANLSIRCHAVFPLDYGDATFTSFESSAAWFDLFDQFPQVDPAKEKTNWHIGKIHSHHSMSVFHSGTDNADLYENAPKLPLFLSVVVNYACQLDAKIAIATESEETVVTISRWRFKGWAKGFKEKRKEEKKTNPIIVVDCEAFYENSDWFIKQLETLKPKPKYVPTQTYHPNNQMGFQGQQATGAGGVIHARMLDNFADLITLGDDNKSAAYIALDKTSKELQVKDMINYRKAVKIYFTDHWFDENFYNTNATHTMVIQCIENYLQNYKNKFLTSELNRAFDELKKEYILLR